MTDALFIVFFRWTLKRIAEVSGLGKIILYLVAVSSVLALLVGPALPYVALSPRNLWLFIDKLSAPYYGLITPLYVAVNISMTNVLDALCLLLLVLVMVLLIAHRLVWPLIKRPIYAANRKQLIKNTNLLGALGTMLLLYAFPNNPVVDWITHFLPNLKGG